MKEDLSEMERRFFFEYIKDGNLAKAAKRAGYKCKTRSGFYNTGKTVLKRIAPTLDDIMDAGGLTDAVIIKSVVDGLKARKVEHFAYQGIVKDTRTSVDFATRARYADIASRIKGMNKEVHAHTGPEGEPIVPHELGEALLDLVRTIAGVKNEEGK